MPKDKKTDAGILRVAGSGARHVGKNGTQRRPARASVPHERGNEVKE